MIFCEKWQICGQKWQKVDSFENIFVHEKMAKKLQKCPKMDKILTFLAIFGNF